MKTVGRKVNPFHCEMRDANHAFCIYIVPNNTHIKNNEVFTLSTR